MLHPDHDALCSLNCICGDDPVAGHVQNPGQLQGLHQSDGQQYAMLRTSLAACPACKRECVGHCTAG